MKLTTYSLKWIAIITMLIDHIGYGFQDQMPNVVYLTCRSIGRISFPIFCFLLVEGFHYTRNRKKYLLRLGIFAIISEYPFDVAMSGAFPANGYQNVFFTLFIGFLTMYLIETYAYLPITLWGIAIVTSYIAEFLHTDYGAIGVMTILCFYIRKKNPALNDSWFGLFICFVPLLLYAIETPIPCIFVILAFIPLLFYSGEKGPGMKYLFYAIYPGHLLLFVLYEKFFLR